MATTWRATLLARELASPGGRFPFCTAFCILWRAGAGKLETTCRATLLARERASPGGPPLCAIACEPRAASSATNSKMILVPFMVVLYGSRMGAGCPRRVFWDASRYCHPPPPPAFKVKPHSLWDRKMVSPKKFPQSPTLRDAWRTRRIQTGPTTQWCSERAKHETTEQTNHMSVLLEKNKFRKDNT